jgi:hypothetical protein
MILATRNWNAIGHWVFERETLGLGDVSTVKPIQNETFDLSRFALTKMNLG